jgi:hypothetical protein
MASALQGACVETRSALRRLAAANHCNSGGNFVESLRQIFGNFSGSRKFIKKISVAPHDALTEK